MSTTLTIGFVQKYHVIATSANGTRGYVCSVNESVTITPDRINAQAYDAEQVALLIEGLTDFYNMTQVTFTRA